MYKKDKHVKKDSITDMIFKKMAHQNQKSVSQKAFKLNPITSPKHDYKKYLNCNNVNNDDKI